ncbi:MAG: DNA mismatch repair protein MutS [Chitinophagales bacterium]|nr:DNA mismatch repair protein MutS [Chitinophagaceae bacterium]MCB9064885.1 DNA mismatch repair protein MutS [Chitinophagales bacterium]
MHIYPAHATEALEFNKICRLLHDKCRTDLAHQYVDDIRFHTKLEYLQKELKQTQEFKSILTSGDRLPNDFTKNLQKELKLLSIARSVLSGQQLISMQQLALNTNDILTWFRKHDPLFPELSALSSNIIYEKAINNIIGAVIDETGEVRDNASRELMSIRTDIAKLRQQLRKVFEGILRRLNKQGYLADISESFLNGRRTVAVFAEHKRIVKGILHGESDSQRTVFIEPEETIDLNNEIFLLERAETKEIQRILAETTQQVAIYHPLLESYYHIAGLYDFIRAKALLAVDMDANLPRLSAHPGVELINAKHPLLLLHNKANQKNTIPLNIKLDRNQRILIISGPNAGGKTVSMKTVGLIQLMAQSGLLIPADSRSEIGIFKQVMIHIGDTQSIEHELSTYSAHLRDMKHIMSFANGKTLFFIDELGSGSDPNLGGAFAEAIVEELAKKHALGIITTHYLNLKVMAGKVNGIVNGAMTFDEAKLEPLYNLQIGKPGSSYTFAIAERSKLPPEIIKRAKKLTEREHFKLDKVLLRTEQQSVQLKKKEQELDKLIKEHEQAKKRYEEISDKESFRQQQNILKLQNQIKKEELEYLRDMERKFKQIIIDWKKAESTEDKQEAIQAAEKVLFRKKQIQANAAMAKKSDKNYKTVGGKPEPGNYVRHKQNHQVGVLSEIKDKKAVVIIGKMPFTVTLDEWVVVSKKEKEKKKSAK